MRICRFREELFISLRANSRASNRNLLPPQRPSSRRYVVGQFERLLPVPHGIVQDRCRPLLGGPAVADLLNSHPFPLDLKPDGLDDSLVEDGSYSDPKVKLYRFYAHAGMVSNDNYALSSRISEWRLDVKWLITH